jgi:predicted nucleic acid-binding protein
VIYLLDVNALIALGFVNHEFHARVARWVRSSSSLQLASCPITEFGFLRVLAQAPACGFTVAQARIVLLRLKQAHRPSYVPCGHSRSVDSSNMGQNA